MEIIAVNDGSTDNSAEIVARYAQQHPCIKLINKENSGVSAARNAGISASTGEYVCFVDSDDYFKIPFADKFYNICKENSLDVIRGWHDIYDDNSGAHVDHPLPEMSYVGKVLDGEEFLRKSIAEHTNEVVPWLGFFRREFLVENGLEFPEGIAYEEDQLFFLKALLAPGCRAMQTDVEFYTYRIREGSCTKAPEFRHTQNVAFIAAEEMELAAGRDKQTADAVRRYASASFYQLTSIFGRVAKAERKKIRTLVPFKMKLDFIRYAYDSHQRIKIALFTFAPWFVELVYKIKKI